MAVVGSVSEHRRLDDVFEEADVKPNPEDDIDVFEKHSNGNSRNGSRRK